MRIVDPRIGITHNFISASSTYNLPRIVSSESGGGGGNHLQIENFDLTPAHAYRPNSHATLKNVGGCTFG